MAKLKFNPAAYQDLGAYALLKNVVENGHLVAEDSRPYKVYSALLTQTGSDAPVATVLENTIGNVSFTYSGPGSYHITSNGLFAGTVPTVTNVFGVIENSTSNYITVDKLDNSMLRLASSDFQFNGQNDLLNNTPIEIRVYN